MGDFGCAGLPTGCCVDPLVHAALYTIRKNALVRAARECAAARNQRHPCLRIDFQRVHLRIARSAKEHPEQRHGTKNASILSNFSIFLPLRLSLEVF